MTQPLERITRPSKKTATHSIIWLHGLGADGHDFADIAPLLRLRPSTRIIFPHAPVRPITVNNGYRMRGWYDIINFSFAPEDDDLTGIEQSSTQILALSAEEEAQGIQPDNILYAGFSQGGVMALYLGLHHPCAGVIALSAYLADREHTPDADCSNIKPILQMHGTQDPVVPYALGKQAHQTLTAKGYTPEWHEYPMQHQVCPPQLDDIAAWLNKQGF